MFDFTDEGLAKKVAEFFEAGKIVSAVCHGPGGLLNVRLSTGEYLLKGRKATGFSWREEELAKRAEAVPFNLEEEMKKAGRRIREGDAALRRACCRGWTADYGPEPEERAGSW